MRGARPTAVAAHGVAERLVPGPAARRAPGGSEAAPGGLGAARRCPTATLEWVEAQDTPAGAAHGCLYVRTHGSAVYRKLGYLARLYLRFSL